MDKKIIIIGAGVAGIAAATRLMDNGFHNITILEAENRIGGRINTISYASNIVDMGAQWCLGENTVVYELANNYGLLKRDTLRYGLLNWKDKGYRTLLDLLMKKLPRSESVIPVEEEILLNKEVLHIDWNSVQAPYVTVECTDGSIYDADHVILTVPLGVLKERHRTMFRPELPSIKKNAIDDLKLDTLNKIYLEFEKPFWPTGWEGLSMQWSKAEQDEMKFRSEDMWLEDVFGFDTVDYQPNILCGWISGKNARVMEQLPESEVLAGSMRLLRMFLKEYTIPEPTSIMRSQWHSNPHFRGSYTSRSMNYEIRRKSVAALALPVTNVLSIPILHFAGEATHVRYYSTVHGAVETGWREAKRIIDLYKTNSASIS